MTLDPALVARLRAIAGTFTAQDWHEDEQFVFDNLDALLARLAAVERERDELSRCRREAEAECARLTAALAKHHTLVVLGHVVPRTGCDFCGLDVARRGEE